MPVSTRETRRLQRKEQRQQAQVRAARTASMRRTGTIVAGVAALAIAVGLIAFFVSRNSSQQASLPGTHANDPVTASGRLYTHIPETQPIQYDSYPPNHGDHYPTPRPWGSYDSQVPDGYF